MKSLFLNVLVAEIAILGTLIFSVPSIVALDLEVFLYGSSEHSLTELCQEILVLLSALLFGLAAWRNPEARALLILVSGLFTCMLIRELDMWLDHIAGGFWIYPALLTAGFSIGYAVRHRSALLPALARFGETRSFAYITAGLLIIIVFSRTFGSGSFWEEIMAENYRPAYKTFKQEGLELLGYILVGFGSVSYCCLSRDGTARPGPAS